MDIFGISSAHPNRAAWWMLQYDLNSVNKTLHGAYTGQWVLNLLPRLGVPTGEHQLVQQMAV